MRPLIGITGCRSDNRYGQPMTELTEAYSRAIVEAGAIPLLVPPFLDRAAPGDLFARLDGILFSGGGDIEPKHYGMEYAGRLIEVDAARDQLELDLLRMAATAHKPFLGICRGCQLLNVGFGGSLYPDLQTNPASGITHDLPGDERAVLVHQVAITAGSRLAAILEQPTMGVNSHHHQGLRAIAPGLHVSARATDGLVEAVELPDHPFGLAVQWHPEWLTGQRWTRALFRSFVEAAAGTA